MNPYELKMQKQDSEGNGRNAGRLECFLSSAAKERATWTFAFILLFAIGILGVFLLHFKTLQQLSDPACARSVLMGLVVLATICSAFVLLFHSACGTQTQEGYRRGREIFMSLVGILGTIVGFYFGSVSLQNQQVAVAKPRFSNQRILTHVVGGSPPYHYSIRFSDPKMTDVKDGVSEGFIDELIDRKPDPGSSITVEVTDARSMLARVQTSVEGVDSGRPETKSTAAQPVVLQH